MSFFSKIKEKFTSNKDKNVSEEVKKYDEGLEKTRNEFVSKLSLLGIKYSKVSEQYFDELEKILISADIGVNTVFNFMDKLRARVKKENISDTKYLNEVIVDELFIIYVNNENLTDKINYNENGPTVILVVGVNGVGKTTTIAKIAHKLKKEGKKILVAAGDTFRAGASEQLEVWGKRIGFEVVTKDYGSDPSSVIFDAIHKAKDEEYDVLLCDTAGRLQTKVNLMNELAKIKRVISREVENAPQETLLVIDATTGQNGLSQAKAFIEATDVSGVVLTKLDGTAKGGIVLAIRDQYNIPIKFIGLGEGVDDLEYFDIEKYVYGLFAEIIEEE